MPRTRSSVAHALAESLPHALPLLSRLRPERREQVVAIWERALSESTWGSLEECPYGPDITAVSLVAHHNAVTQGALELLRADRAHGDGEDEADEEVLVMAGLTHDVSKLVEYEPGPSGPQYSQIGRQLQHAAVAVGWAREYDFPLEVVAIIAHHTPQSNRVPASPEGLLIVYADLALADLYRLKRGARLHASDFH